MVCSYICMHTAHFYLITLFGLYGLFALNKTKNQGQDNSLRFACYCFNPKRCCQVKFSINVQHLPALLMSVPHLVIGELTFYIIMSRESVKTMCPCVSFESWYIIQWRGMRNRAVRHDVITAKQKWRHSYVLIWTPIWCIEKFKQYR